MDALEDAESFRACQQGAQPAVAFVPRASPVHIGKEGHALHPCGIISYGTDNCRIGVLLPVTSEVSAFFTKSSLSLDCVTSLLSILFALNEH